MELYYITAFTLIAIIIQFVIGVINWYRNADLGDPQHKLKRKRVVVMRLDVWIIFLMCIDQIDISTWEWVAVSTVLFLLVCGIQIIVFRD